MRVMMPTTWFLSSTTMRWRRPSDTKAWCARLAEQSLLTVKGDLRGGKRRGAVGGVCVGGGARAEGGAWVSGGWGLQQRTGLGWWTALGVVVQHVRLQ